MHLASVKLTCFKNYENLDLTFSPRLNCFTGLNGTGKTNILDAVHYLCLCKSYSGLADKSVIKHGNSFFRVEGIMKTKEGAQHKVAAKFLAGQKKIMEQDGVEFGRLADYIGLYPAVMIAPDDVALVQEGSDERRRFLDNALSQLSREYLNNLLTYNNVLKQRNSLLKQFADERRFDGVLLAVYNHQMLAPAQVIFEHREAFAGTLIPLFRDLYAEISGGREMVQIDYSSEMEGRDLATLLVDATDKDRALQRSTVGPHRDDLLLTMDGQPVKKFASQGQLKSFLLSLRLAQYEVLRQQKDTDPILLLDDIFDKLDEQRVRHLIGLLLRRQFGQIFITDTQRSRIESVLTSLTTDYRLFETDSLNK